MFVEISFVKLTDLAFVHNVATVSTEALPEASKQGLRKVISSYNFAHDEGKTEEDRRLAVLDT